MDENSTLETKRSSSWMVAATCSVLVLLVTAGGVFALHDQLQVKAQADAKIQKAERDKLSDRINALQSSLETLGSQPTADNNLLTGITTQLTEANAKLDAFSSRLEAVEKKMEEAPAPVAVVAPAAPVAAAPAPASPETQGAFATLKLAVMSGKPFATELAEWLKRYPTAEKDTVALSALAETGMMTEGALTRELLSTLEGTNKSTTIEDTSTVGKINTHLKGLVSIKKNNTDPYANLRKDVMRADSITLAREIERLSETDRAPLNSWLQQAKAREAAINALAKLSLNEGR